MTPLPAPPLLSPLPLLAASVGLLAVLLLLVLALLPSLLIRAVLVPLQPQVRFCGSGPERRLALTIDDGPSGPGSRALLELLEALQVPATFFLIGSHLERDPAFPRLALERGHGLGNHLWRDERSAALDAAGFRQQLADTAAAIGRGAAPRPLRLRWCRPGQGWFHRRMLAWLQAGGYGLVLASIFPWDTLRPPLAFIRWFVRLNAHPGGILVLHDTPALNARTQAALRLIVPDLRARGFRFVPLDALLEGRG